LRNYKVTITHAEIQYNDFTTPDFRGVVYRPRDEESDFARTPLVIRANQGECLQVSLKNETSDRAGFSLGELLFRPQQSYGAAIGFNLDSTVAPGRERTYKFYADRELGTTFALNFGHPESIELGAFAGVVVEPEGSRWFRPGTNDALPEGGYGVQADIVHDGGSFREFVALFNDQDRQLGQNAMPYPELPGPTTFSGISYSAEPLRLREILNAPADVFKSDLWGDPRHVVTVPAGTPLVYRVAAPWGHQTHVPTLEGHRWLLEPGLPGSEQVFNDVIVPGQSIDLYFVGGAGGDIHAPGDFLFLDRRQPFLEAGLWNILRVTDGDAVGMDSVRVMDTRTAPATAADMGGDARAAAKAKVLELDGILGVRPAGDTARWVRLYEGVEADGQCSGAYLGQAPVDSGSGRWTFRQALKQLPAQVCVQSAGGGVKAVKVAR
jgi:hypothetical protein